MSIRLLILCAALTVVLCGGNAHALMAGGEAELEAKAIKLAKDAQTGGYKLLGTEELKKWVDEKKPMVIVDTMPFDDSYKKSHIVGALNFVFPIPDMTEWNPAETGGKSKEDFIKMLGPDKAKPIVVYCGFVKCTRSHNGAMWAVKLGYTNVYRHPAGIKGWEEEKYPVEGAK